MDVLLKRKTLGFWIDELFPNDKEGYTATIIPNIKSTFFPPYHLRAINISPDLLEKNFYYATQKNNDSNKGYDFRGSVIQGRYYEVPTKLLKEREAFNPKSIINLKNDIFMDNMKTSPYGEEGIIGEKKLDYNAISTDKLLLKKGKIFLYCFNVGQGDSFLLIPSSGNPYIIDTNIYSYEQAKKFVITIKTILKEHGLDDNRIKGLVITHKHIDHLRGAAYMLNQNKLEIENFFINLDYVHSTNCVDELMKAARAHIGTWVNTNTPGMIQEGDTYICIKNPDSSTSNVSGAPDINDSSICLCIRYYDNLIYMTGDAGHDVINNKYACTNLYFNQSLLKVSHHGSRTGTNDSVINLLNPSYAFVSVGHSKKYKHPHKEALTCLKPLSSRMILSRKVKTTIRYTFDGKQIKATRC